MFSRSAYVIEFLQQNNGEVFEAFKVRAKQEGVATDKRLESPLELKSETGMATCYPSLSQTYVTQLKAFVESSEAIKRSLKRKSASIINCLQQLSLELNEFSEDMMHLANLQSSIAEASCHQDIYRHVGVMLKQWAAHESSLANVVNEYLGMFFKYRYTEMTALGELLKDRESFRNAYLKAEGKLRTKKEQLWGRKDDLESWKLDLNRSQIPDLLDNKSLAFTHMLPTETLQVKHLKDMYGFLHYQTHADTAKLLAETTQLESLHFADMARIQDEKGQILCASWRELIDKLSEFFPRSQVYQLCFR